MARPIVHGYCRRDAETKEWKAWAAMKHRCSNAKAKHFDKYGGRGITICERWRKFENFLADMGHAPSAKHSLDRINNDGNYEPGNCLWRTSTEQNRNRTLNVFISFAGKTQCISAWVEETGLAHYTIRKRLSSGWSPEQILTTPSRGKHWSGTRASRPSG